MIVRNILNAIKELNSKINDLQTQLNNKKDKTISVTTANTNLNDYIETGIYYFSGTYTPTNIPSGTNGWLLVIKNDDNAIKQLWFRYGTANSNDYNTYVRTKFSSGWSNWKQFTTE